MHTHLDVSREFDSRNKRSKITAFQGWPFRLFSSLDAKISQAFYESLAYLRRNLYFGRRILLKIVLKIDFSFFFGWIGYTFFIITYIDNIITIYQISPCGKKLKKQV